ncbi:hypothetical protein [Burkholderia sola]|uniref:hypothetical protein n=1 Tax=Burkholderia sola TaxID=2843302 RepID=UPI0026AFD4B3
MGVAPTPAHVASRGGIRNCAGNFAGIFITTFTDVMLSIATGSFVAPLAVAGGLCVVVVGKVEPVPPPPRGSSGPIAEPNAA